MANEKNDGARESPGQQAPARGKLSDHLLEAGLRAVFAAGAQSPPPPPRPLETEVPQRIGRYDVVDVIGQGGVGVVLKARDAELRREIAIKLLLPSHGRNPGIRHRFIEESQVAGQLEHPGIVSVHEAGLFDGDRPYFTMKLVKGRTLAALLQERENVVADRVRFLGIFEQVAQTIAYAHSRGVIHRDLKPSNIMVGAFGEVQVMDWGLAKVIARDLTAAEPAVDGSLPAGLGDEVRTLRTDAADSRSLAGSVLGTPAYMAPEQARGEVKLLDSRADVFGLGAILCEILTGSPPFRGKTTDEIFRRSQSGDVDEARGRVEACGADAEIVSLARACLAADSKERPADAGAVAEALKVHRESLEARARRLALEAAEARVKAEGERRARRLTIGLVAMVGVTLLLGSGGFLWVEAERRDQVRATEDLVNRAMGEARQLRGQSGLGAAEDSAVDVSRMEAAEAAGRRAQERAQGTGVMLSLKERAEELHAQLEIELERVRRAKAQAAQNLRAVDELERIRAAFLDDRDPRKTNAAYAKAFQEFLRVDIEALDPEAAASAMKGTGIASALATALDDWARARREIRGEVAPPWKGLMQLAELADPDPRRVSLRQAIRNEDPSILQRLTSPAALEGASARDFGIVFQGLNAHSDLAGSLSVLRLAYGRYPDDFWILINLATECMFANRTGFHQPPRYEEPIRYLTAARTLRPRNTFVQATLSRAFLDQGQTQAAIEAAREGLSVRPDDTALLYSLSLALKASGDADEAEKICRKALRIEPDTAWLHSNLGMLLADRGDMQAAVTSMTRALELNSGEASTLCGLGSISFELGRREEAIAQLKTATELAPDLAIAHNNLGYALLRSQRLEEAVSPLKVAIRKNPSYVPSRNNLGMTYLRLERHAEAMAEFLEAIRLEPTNSYAFNQLLQILENEKVGDLGKPLEDLILTLDRLLYSKEKSHRLAARTFVTAWCLRPQTLDYASPIKVADLEVQRTARQDPIALRLLGRAYSIAGRTREAVLTLEESRGSPEEPSWVASMLAAARAALLPDLVSYASIDAAVDLVDASATLERARDGFAAFRTVARSADGPARLRYLDARLLQRFGAREEAATAYRELLALDRSRPEPFLRLWETLEAGGDRARAPQIFREDLDRLGLPPQTLPVPARRPRNLDPAAQSSVQGEAVELRATPFDPIDPRVKLLASRWQIREPKGDYSRNPALDVVTGADPESLRVPPGLLLPSTEYSWHVFRVGSDGRASEYSEESSFTTQAAPVEAVPFDLSPLFNRDVVADPGDAENDTFDSSEGSVLLVDGFDGERDGVAGVRGLPRDRIVGVHRLGDPRGLNALQLSRWDPTAVRLTIPRGSYSCIRFLVAGGNGNSSMPVVFEFAGGGAEKHDLPCDDWYHDLPPARRPSPSVGSIPIWNGMDRLARGKFEAAHEPALFEVLIPVTGDQEIEAIVLDPTAASFHDHRTRFHLFAVTGMRRK